MSCLSCARLHIRDADRHYYYCYAKMFELTEFNSQELAEDFMEKMAVACPERVIFGGEVLGCDPEPEIGHIKAAAKFRDKNGHSWHENTWETHVVFMDNRPEGVDSRTVSRNDPCPCEGGKKFKRCHGK